LALRFFLVFFPAAFFGDDLFLIAILFTSYFYYTVDFSKAKVPLIEDMDM
jgi:hypothetical protein